MNELSLHILDIVQNSIKANATLVKIIINDNTIDNDYTITIEDNGHGIDPETQKNIFDPFITKKSKGTGLGLSISQRIVQEHGGEISVESEFGKGSVFSIYLPAIDKQ